MPQRTRFGYAAAVLLAAGAAWRLTRHLTRFEVVELSMAPTLLPGDYLVGRRLDGECRRGDIVVYTHPGGSMAVVKRVVALPGELVEIAAGQVLVDHRPLVEPWGDGPTPGSGIWTVGRDEVFTLGDARARSAGDSRELGPIPLRLVGHRVLGRYWPPHRLGITGRATGI